MVVQHNMIIRVHGISDAVHTYTPHTTTDTPPIITIDIIHSGTGTGEHYNHLIAKTGNTKREYKGKNQTAQTQKSAQPSRPKPNKVIAQRVTLPAVIPTKISIKDYVSPEQVATLASWLEDDLVAYSDGSLCAMGKTNVSMGAGFIIINAKDHRKNMTEADFFHIPHIMMSGQCDGEASSTKAEIIAGLYCMSIIPPHINVLLHTDNQGFVNALRETSAQHPIDGIAVNSM